MRIFLLTLLFLVSYNVIGQQNEKHSLIVIGASNTRDNAKENAIINSLKQFFSVFITSKPELISENTKPEVVSSLIKSGILDYKVLSESEMSEGNWNVVIITHVSVDKLISVFESKGVISEFKGNTISSAIKLQNLNETAEFDYIYNSVVSGFNFIANSVDFKVTTSTPKFIGSGDIYRVQINVDYTTNEYLDSFYLYFHDVISQIAMSESEINSYNTIERPVYDIIINKSDTQATYRLRNSESLKYIYTLLCFSNVFSLDFSLYAESDTLFVKPMFRNERDYGQVKKFQISLYPTMDSTNLDAETWYPIAIKDGCTESSSYYNDPIIPFYTYERTECNPRHFEVMQKFLESFSQYRNKGYSKEKISRIYFDFTSKPKGTMLIRHNITLKQMEKFTNYKIIKHSPEFLMAIKNNAKNDTWLKWLYGIKDQVEIPIEFFGNWAVSNCEYPNLSIQKTNDSYSISGNEWSSEKVEIKFKDGFYIAEIFGFTEGEEFTKTLRFKLNAQKQLYLDEETYKFAVGDSRLNPGKTIFKCR